MKKKKTLETKIKEAKERTRQWASGVNVEFPIEKIEAEERLAEEVGEELKEQEEREREEGYLPEKN